MDHTRAPARLRSLPSWLLARTALQAGRVVGDALTGAGSSRPEFTTLATLDEFGPVQQSELADRSGQDAGDTARLLADLERRRLIVREPDPADRRRRLVAISPRGRETLEAVHLAVVAAGEVALDRLDADERRTLAELLGRSLGLDDAD